MIDENPILTMVTMAQYTDAANSEGVHPHNPAYDGPRPVNKRDYSYFIKQGKVRLIHNAPLFLSKEGYGPSVNFIELIFEALLFVLLHDFVLWQCLPELN